MAYGPANKEGTSKHGNGCRNSGDNDQIRSPVVFKITDYESA